jgi:hypothetical protein
MTYRLIERKRTWIPEWLFRLLCFGRPGSWMRRWMLIQPFRWILFTKVSE